MFARQRIRNRGDAEEVVQEALMTIYAEYKSITFNASFSAWAYKVLNNRILNSLRKKQHESQRIDESICPKSVPSEVDVNGASDLKRRLLDCLQRIGDRNIRYARILNLHYQGYRTDEICDRLKVIPETFYSILSRARTLLEVCLEKGDLK